MRIMLISFLLWISSSGAVAQTSQAPPIKSAADQDFEHPPDSRAAVEIEKVHVGLGAILLAELQELVERMERRIRSSQVVYDEQDQGSTRTTDNVEMSASKSPRAQKALLLLEQIRKNLNLLQQEHEDQLTFVPEVFSESLNLSQIALEGVYPYGETSIKDLETLSAVAADLRVKAEHVSLVDKSASTGPVFTSFAGAYLVEVAVHTRQQDKEVGGYEVWFAPAAFGDGSRDRRFDEYSSPTSQDLAPGNYYLWARNPANGTKGERQVFSIGQGHTSHKIDIPAP